MKHFLAAFFLLSTTLLPMTAAHAETDPLGNDPLLKEVNSLLIENRVIIGKIANKLGVLYSTSQQTGGTLPEMNNAIFIRNQFLIKQIAAKLGVATDTPLPVSGSLSEQNQ